MQAINAEALELTPYQKLFYNEWLLAPDSGRYNMVLDQVLSGQLDIQRLNQSLIRLINSHLILNSNVGSTGENVYWIQREPIPSSTQLLVYHTKELSEQDLLAIVSKPFDLQRDLLARFHAIRLKNGRTRIIYILQHVTIDAVSYSSIVAETGRLYNESNYTNPIGITEQIRRHRTLTSDLNQIISEGRAEMESFWKRWLEGISGEDLAFLKPASCDSLRAPASTPRNRVSEFRFHFDNNTLTKVNQLKRKHKLTPYLFGQLVFGILLHKMGGKKALGVGFPVAILEGKELIYGAHINNLITPFRFDSNTTLADLIRSTLDFYAELKSSKSKYLPVYEIARYAADSVWQESGFIQTDLKDIPMLYEGIEGVEVKSDWNIDLPHKLLFEQELQKCGINYRVRYDNETMDGELVKRFIGYYCGLFNRTLEDLLNDKAHKRIEDCEILDAAERDAMVYGWNATAHPYASDKTIHQLFEEQVERTPDHIALVYEDVTLTYRQINERSNQLAAYLEDRYSLAPDDLVSICLDRSERMLIAILAVLKTGAAYVPIDAACPGEQIRYILEDTKAKVAVTDEAHLSLMEKAATNLPLSIESLDTPELQSALPAYAVTNLSSSAARPCNLFYVIYTSGTTGNPKGVMIEHGQITPILAAIREAYDFKERAKISAFTSFGFDVSSSEFFISLLHGNELHLLSDRLRTDANALSEYLQSNEIEYAYLPPAMLAALPKVDYSRLKTTIYAGEPCDRQTGEYWSIAKKLYNYYGPSETNIATGKLIYNGDVHLIGRPVANATAHVLDDNLHPLPVGAVGELYIGGAGVARGYLNLPQLTRERFLPNPFQTQEEKAVHRNSRLYKTGDRVRYLPDSNLEFIGRNDFQVKIRGYRIELGGIEARICQFPGIKQAIVLAKGHGSSKHLIGYYVADQPIDRETLHAYLGRHLPEYMVPSALVRIEKMPVTINGKVNRKALSELEWTDDQEHQRPENPIQERLCSLYAEILAIDPSKVGIDSDFFKLGGNSISAIKLVGRINGALQISVSAVAIYKSKTVRKLSELLAGSVDGFQISVPVVPNADDCRLSFAQERLWFIGTYEGGNSAYNIPVMFRIKTTTCIDSLIAALQKVVERHEILRTYIKTDAHGEGCQAVQEASKALIPVETIEVSSSAELDEALSRSASYSFKLDRECPIRITLFHLLANVEDFGEAYLSLVIHHIAFDGWSAGIMLREIAALYQALVHPKSAQALPAVSLQYRDFARWQRSYLTGAVLTEQLAYWKDKLAGCEFSQLPTDRPRPSKINYDGAEVRFELDPAFSGQLRETAKDLGVTLYSVLLSGYYLFLSSYGNQKDIVIGTPIANRHHSQLQNAIGFFVNTLALRQIINSDDTLADFINQVGQSVTEAQLHQDLPFEKLVSELPLDRDPSRHPLFQVMFAMQSPFNFNALLGDLMEVYQPELKQGYSPAKFDLTTSLADENGVISGSFNYATGLFDKSTILNFISTYKTILSQLTSSTEIKKRKVRELSYLNPSDYRKTIWDWSGAAEEYPPDKTICQLFEEQVRKKRNEVALVYESTELTYGQLHERSAQLAGYLKDRYEIVPEDRIALFLDRSEHPVIAMLAVLGAGGAYVPIDPNAPAERVRHILQDTGAKIALTNEMHAARLGEIAGGLALSIESVDGPDLAGLLKNYPASNLPASASSHHLCYIIYTSGTTGQPKGVMLEHRGVANLVANFSEALETARDADKESCNNYLWFASYVFDAHVFEIFIAILCGRKLFVASNALRANTSLLYDYIRRNKIHLAALPPALLEESVPSLKIMVAGGDVTPPEVIRSYLEKNVTFVNGYGPTESTVCSTAHFCTKDSSNTTIGRPMANITTYVLNDNLVPLPIGAVGELYVGGGRIARGYLNRPELTRERFLRNPFQTELEKAKGRNARLYKTGDLVRYLPNGNLEFMGRNDHQIKIRGFRIEPGEIEVKMRAFPEIKQSFVLAKEQEATRSKNLVGYFVADSVIDRDALHAYLRDHLPEYMTPSALIQIETLPLTVNGKVDRKALPEPELNNGNAYCGPENSLQERLCTLYAETLGMEPREIGIDDNFFRLGGNSISAIKLVTRLNKALNITLSAATFFNSKTVRKLSEVISLRSSVVRLNNTVGKDNLFMIHPAFAGCEVYVPLSETLNGHFCCVGIDSYNLYHAQQISDLKQLATQYLASIDELQNETSQKSYAFLGWSLGGQIALEMAAALESRGVKDITVYLLDTLLSDETLDGMRTVPTDKEINDYKERMGNAGVHSEDYRTFFLAETSLSAQPISRSLQYTKIVLFKAMGTNEKSTDQLNEHVRLLKYNNVEKAVASTNQIKVIKLRDFHHWNILAANDTIASELTVRSLVSSDSLQQNASDPLSQEIQDLEFLIPDLSQVP